MKTAWRCEKCGNSGEHIHTNKAGVWEIAQEIKDQHYQANRFCEWDALKVRVHLIERQDSEVKEDTEP